MRLQGSGLDSLKGQSSSRPNGMIPSPSGLAETSTTL